MGRQIIKQPNSKYCIFSSVVDSIVVYNCTKDEILEEQTTTYGVMVANSTERVFEQLEAGEKPYHQFTLSYSEMLEEIKLQHGEEEMNNVKSVIEK